MCGKCRQPDALKAAGPCGFLSPFLEVHDTSLPPPPCPSFSIRYDKTVITRSIFTGKRPNPQARRKRGEWQNDSEKNTYKQAFPSKGCREKKRRERSVEDRVQAPSHSKPRHPPWGHEALSGLPARPTQRLPDVPGIWPGHLKGRSRPSRGSPSHASSVTLLRVGPIYHPTPAQAGAPRVSATAAAELPTMTPRSPPQLGVTGRPLRFSAFTEKRSKILQLLPLGDTSVSAAQHELPPWPCLLQ